MIEKRTTQRRGLLFGASAVAAGATALALMPKAAQTAASAVVAPQVMPEKGGGYQVSEHVKHYYRTTTV